MYICYIDESGTSAIPGNTSHFVLVGISIPVWQWKNCDREIEQIKDKFSLGGSEIHVGWMLRPYIEQNRCKLATSLMVLEVNKMPIFDDNEQLDNHTNSNKT